MSARFDGAITTPADVLDSTREPPPARPPRPVSIEISAAILIVGGLLAAVTTVAATLGQYPAAADPGARLVIALLVALNLLTVIVGLLVRRGSAWILCINVAAIVLFVELTAIPGGSSSAAVLAVLDGFVFVALLRNRAWFEWQPPTEVAA